MADKTNKLTYVIQIDEKGKVQVDGLTRGFVKLDNAVKKVNQDLRKQAAALNKTSSASSNMIDKTGLAGATLVELGRTISDSNYGIRGMANNISQLSTLFITLIATSGGLAKGLKQLWSALYGPLGLILAFQTIVTIIEKFSMDQDAAAAAARRATKALKEQASAVEDLESKISALQSSLAIIQTFGDGYLSFSEVVDVLTRKFKDFENGYKRLTEEQQKDPETVGRLIKAYKRYILIRQSLSEKEKEALALQRQIAKEGETITKGGLTFQNPALLTLSGINREIAELYKEETRLFDLFKNIPKGVSDARKKVEALDLDFSKKFFILDEEGLIQVVDTYAEFLDIMLDRMAKGTEPIGEMLKRAGEDYKELEKQGEESLRAGLKFIKDEAKRITDVFRATQQALSHVSDVILSYHDARMDALKRERDYALHSGKLTGDAQREALADIEKREIKAQERKIKAERDLFTMKQSLLIAEEIMKIKADFLERKRMFEQQTIYFINAQGRIVAKAAESTADAQFSIGEFVRQLGPLGVAAYAITIGGLMASILAARKRAQAALSSLGAPSMGGGGGGAPGGVEAPDFNVVGASPESQLAQSITGQQEKPLRAFVVNKDIKDAQELDRAIDFNRSLG